MNEITTPLPQTDEMTPEMLAELSNGKGNYDDDRAD